MTIQKMETSAQTRVLSQLLQILRIEQRELAPILGRTGISVVVDGKFLGSIAINKAPPHLQEMVQKATGNIKFANNERSGIVVSTRDFDHHIALSQLSLS